jgi:hypothetical protein
MSVEEFFELAGIVGCVEIGLHLIRCAFGWL